MKFPYLLPSKHPLSQLIIFWHSCALSWLLCSRHTGYCRQDSMSNHFLAWNFFCRKVTDHILLLTLLHFESIFVSVYACHHTCSPLRDCSRSDCQHIYAGFLQVCWAEVLTKDDGFWLTKGQCTYQWQKNWNLWWSYQRLRRNWVGEVSPVF